MEESKPTFWEKLGRGVAQGFEKVKETSRSIGEFAALKLDIKNARDHLENRYRLLGRIAADRFIDRNETSIEREEPAVKTALEEIRSARSTLAALEAKLVESQSEHEKEPPTPQS
jgi:hypothetical protein